MLKNYFKLAFRNFLKDKVFSTINFMNLVIGFATFILFGLFIFYEISWDKQNENYDRIYRVQLRIEQSNDTELRTYTPPAVYFHTLDSVVGIEKTLLLKEAGGVYLGTNMNDWIYDRTGYITTPGIFSIFTYHFIEGDPATALKEPNSIAISETFAHKLFPDGNAYGKTVIGEKQFFLKVTGIYKDLPENSTIRPAFLVSFATVDHNPELTDIRDDWWNIIYDTYVLLDPGTDPTVINSKIKDAFHGIRDREKYYAYLRPLSKLYVAPNSSDMTLALSVLSFGGLLILILSCINFINLATANASTRAKEIGIKKVAGSSRISLIVQFLAETVIITVLASLLAVIIAQAAIPLFDNVIGRPMQLNVFQHIPLLIILFLASLLAGLFSGLYPAFVISSFTPAKVLKGKLFDAVKGGFNMKKVLVIAQFTISLYMVLSSFILYSQMDYMMKKPLGFNTGNMLYAYLKNPGNISYETMKDRLLKNPEILDVSFSRTIPFHDNIGGYFQWEDSPSDEKLLTSRNYVSYDFVDTYGLKITRGRDFRRGNRSDRGTCLINETALKSFGWDDPVGKHIMYSDKKFQVIGVVSDFHPFSIYQAIPAYVFLMNPDSISSDGYLTVRAARGKENDIKPFLQEEIGRFYPQSVFEFNDLETSVQHDYALQAYATFGRISAFFTVITVMIASIGLFGLILFSVKRRTREFGIRKAFGSSGFSIFYLLSGEILRMIGIAALVAIPLSWYEYDILPGASKYPFSIWQIILGIVILSLVSLITISWHIYRASRINPVEALRYE